VIGSRKITLQFSVTWLVGICLVALGLILAFILGQESWRPTLIFTAAVFGGAGALIAAVNALDSRIAQGQQARMAVSLDFINRWNDPQFFHAKRNGREVVSELRQRQTPDEQMKYLQEDRARYSNLLDVLNVFEGLSGAIQMGIADEETAKRFFRSIVLEYWHVTQGFIKQRRAERQNARMLRDFEWLFNRWRD